MKVAPGARLGHYRVESALGTGGMGEVYRAIDTRLNRSVAIKILSPVADSPTRRERFEREARIVSTLSHPNICALYDVGEDHGAPFLVMEHLEGETLASRLARGPLPIEEALRHGVEVASALDHAHRRGVVHRDLKPQNIMLTASGVKLLDFGVAALCTAEPTDAPGGVANTQTLTEERTIVGTTAYMAPEQLQGRSADVRSDIFSLGVVLYEMATGVRPFDGSTPADIIAAIFARDPPPVSAVPTTEGGRSADETAVPPVFDEIVARCLAKQRDRRWQTATDLEQSLRWVLAGTGSGAATWPRQAGDVRGIRARPRHMPRIRARWLAAAASVLAIVGVIIAAVERPELAGTPPVAFTISPPEGATFNPAGTFMALSPDGHSLAFVAASPEHDTALWVRSLDSAVAQPLAGTDGAVQPYWSGDSRSLAFGGMGKVKKIDLATGLVTTLVDCRGYSGAWSRQGVVLFKPLDDNPIYRVSASGGNPIPATALDRAHGDASHNWPAFLPDGRHFLYLARRNRPQYDSIVVGALDSPATTQLLPSASQAVYVPPGYLLFVQGGTLLAQAFDARTLHLTGSPVSVAKGVEYNPASGRATFSASETGVLAYRRVGTTRLLWFDRDGHPLGSVGVPGYYRNPVLSPDERWIAVARQDPAASTQDIWMVDVDRSVASPFTFDGHADMPVWSADGSHLVFKTWAGFRERSVTRSGDDYRILDDGDMHAVPLEFTRDGRTLLYEHTGPGGQVGRHISLSVLSVVGRQESRPVVRTSFANVQGRLSPDGRRLAYVSNESGRHEVYIQAFPEGDGRCQVSSGGGLEPQWRRDGRELFFLASDGSLMAVSVEAGPVCGFGQPRRLFETRMSTVWNGSYNRNQYAVTRDGQRFLVNEPSGQPSPITVVVNWAAKLKSQVANR